MNVRAWLAPGPPIVPFPPNTEPCGRIDAFVPPNGEGDAPGALKTFGCVVVVPKGELVVEAPNAEGEAAGAPKGTQEPHRRLQLACQMRLGYSRHRKLPAAKTSRERHAFWDARPGSGQGSFQI